MMTFEGLHRRLEELLGTSNVWTDEVRRAAHAVDRRQPRLVVQPETTAQAGCVICCSACAWPCPTARWRILADES
jgi:hypothetical protein